MRLEEVVNRLKDCGKVLHEGGDADVIARFLEITAERIQSEGVTEQPHL